MKRFIILLAFIPLLMQAQVKPSTNYTIADSTTLFGKNLPAGTTIKDIATGYVYSLDESALATHKISTAPGIHRIDGGGSADLGNWSFDGDTLFNDADAILTVSGDTVKQLFPVSLFEKLKVNTLDNLYAIPDKMVGWNSTDKYLKEVSLNPRIKFDGNNLDADYDLATWNANKLDSADLPATFKDGNVLTYNSSTGNFENLFYSDLFSKKWMAYGASITQGGTYTDTTLYYTGITDFVNNGLAGNKCYDINLRLAASLSSDPSYLDDVDILTLQVGHNDFYQSYPVGKISDTVNQLTYIGQMKYFIEMALNANPELEIYIISVYQCARDPYNYGDINLRGYYLKDYYNAQIQTAKLYSVPLIDWYSLSGINEQTMEVMTTDSLHPSAFGGNILGRIVAKAFVNQRSGSSISVGNVDLTDYINERTRDDARYYFNGTVGDITHTSVSFADGEPWSMVFNYIPIGAPPYSSDRYLYVSTTARGLGLRTSNNTYFYRNSTGYNYFSVSGSPVPGIEEMVILTASGTGGLKLYRRGILMDSLSGKVTDVIWTKIAGTIYDLESEVLNVQIYDVELNKYQVDSLTTNIRDIPRSLQDNVVLNYGNFKTAAKWYDESGNNNNGTVTSATLLNPQREYQMQIDTAAAHVARIAALETGGGSFDPTYLEDTNAAQREDINDLVARDTLPFPARHGTLMFFDSINNIWDTTPSQKLSYKNDKLNWKDATLGTAGYINLSSGNINLPFNAQLSIYESAVLYQSGTYKRFGGSNDDWWVAGNNDIGAEVNSSNVLFYDQSETTWTLTGSLRTTPVTLTSTATVPKTATLIICNPAAVSQVYTLPAFTGLSGMIYTFINVSVNDATIAPAESDNVNGAASGVTLPAGETMVIINTGVSGYGWNIKQR